VKRMCPAKRAVFFKGQLVRSLTFVLCSRIIPILTAFAGQCYDISHMENLSPACGSGSTQPLSDIRRTKIVIQIYS